MNINPAMLLTPQGGGLQAPQGTQLEKTVTSGNENIFSLLLEGELGEALGKLAGAGQGEGPVAALQFKAAWEQTLPQGGKPLPVPATAVQYGQDLPQETLQALSQALRTRLAEQPESDPLQGLELVSGEQLADSADPSRLIPLAPRPLTDRAPGQPGHDPATLLASVLRHLPTGGDAAPAPVERQGGEPPAPGPQLGMAADPARLMQAVIAREAVEPATEHGRHASTPSPANDTAPAPQHSTSVALGAIDARAGSEIAAPRGTGPVLHMDQPMGKPGWDSELGNRILWMTRQDVQSAQLRLNPPNLGPLDVRVSVQHEGASVAFVSQHVQVREAIEAALPRLREMLADQGYDLVDVDVSDRSPAREQGGELRNASHGTTADGIGGVMSGDLADESEPGDVLGSGDGLIDFFA